MILYFSPPCYFTEEVSKTDNMDTRRRPLIRKRNGYFQDQVAKPIESTGC
jgi:hypothetical protein